MLATIEPCSAIPEITSIFVPVFAPNSERYSIMSWSVTIVSNDLQDEHGEFSSSVLVDITFVLSIIVSRVS